MQLKNKISAVFMTALLATSGTAFSETHQTKLISSFPSSGTTFAPSDLMQLRLEDARNAALVVINGRTSTARNSAADEILALKRALSARKYIIENYGVSPLKIQLNFVSASDFITENYSDRGRLENQRVEIVMHFVQPKSQAIHKESL